MNQLGKRVTRGGGGVTLTSPSLCSTAGSGQIFTGEVNGFPSSADISMMIVPLLTVETDVNGDSKITNERGPSLAALVGPVQNIVILAVHYFNFVPIAHMLGRQPCWVACLLGKCLW